MKSRSVKRLVFLITATLAPTDRERESSYLPKKCSAQKFELLLDMRHSAIGQHPQGKRNQNYIIYGFGRAFLAKNSETDYNIICFRMFSSRKLDKLFRMLTQLSTHL